MRGSIRETSEALDLWERSAVYHPNDSGLRGATSIPGDFPVPNDFSWALPEADPKMKI